MSLKESFEWAGKPVNSANLLKLISKTESTTYHPDDPAYPVRIFSEKELELAARTLIGKPVGRNHESTPIDGAFVLDSEYGASKAVESIAIVPDDWVSKVKSGLVKSCSVEYTWRTEKRNEAAKSVEFEGLVFTRVDLLEGLNPGDPKAVVSLFESDNAKTARFITLVEAYPFPTPSTARNPAADPVIGETIPAADFKELTEAFQRVTAELAAVKKDFNVKLKTETASAVKSVVDDVDSRFPKQYFKDHKLTRLITEVREVLNEHIEQT
jgi:hypothetical protein